jgi:hypothetical protein
MKDVAHMGSIAGVFTKKNKAADQGLADFLKVSNKGRCELASTSMGGGERR